VPQADAAALQEQVAALQQQLEASRQQVAALQAALRDKTERGSRLRQGYERCACLACLSFLFHPPR
jgi:hypothetical protein